MITLFIGTNIWRFLNTYGLIELKMPDYTNAIMVRIMLVVRFVFAGLLGVLADKIGPKKVWPYWMLVACAACLPAVILQNPLGVYLSIGLAYFFKSGSDTAGTSLSYGLPKPEHRAGHFSITLVLGTVMLSLGPVLMGVFGEKYSLHTMFKVVAVIAVLMFFVVKFLVRTFPDSTKDLS